jgi:hypothetical protein
VLESGHKKRYTESEWEERMTHIAPSRELINKLVMNYLVIEGYKTGAQKFEKESGVKGKPNTD